MTLLRQLARWVVPGRLRPPLRLLGERIQPLFYLGRRVECPCCGARYSRFLPFGRPIRPNARCPRCDSLERHRALALFLERYVPRLPGQHRMLHFAPEKALRHALSRRFPGYLTTDYSAPGVDVLMDITSLALPDSSLDALLCVHVLEHIPDDRRAMRELWRVLKPGAWGILQVPLDASLETTHEDPSIIAPEERRRHYGQEDHVRLYGRDFKNRLEGAGFLVEIRVFGQMLSEAERLRHGIPPDEEVYWCTKPVGHAGQ